MPKAAFSEGFGGVCTLASSDDFVDVVAPTAVLQVFFWLNLFVLFTKRLFFVFDAMPFFFCFNLPLAVALAGSPARFFLLDFVMVCEI